MRQTVTIRMPDETEPRRFHLEAEKATRFAAKVEAAGGTAAIGPLELSDELRDTLQRASVNPSMVR